HDSLSVGGVLVLDAPCVLHLRKNPPETIPLQFHHGVIVPGLDRPALLVVCELLRQAVRALPSNQSPCGIAALFDESSVGKVNFHSPAHDVVFVPLDPAIEQFFLDDATLNVAPPFEALTHAVREGRYPPFAVIFHPDSVSVRVGPRHEAAVLVVVPRVALVPRADPLCQVTEALGLVAGWRRAVVSDRDRPVHGVEPTDANNALSVVNGGFIAEVVILDPGDE